MIEQAKQEALEAFKKQQEDKELSKLSEKERLQKYLENHYYFENTINKQYGAYYPWHDKKDESLKGWSFFV